ncbi:hypothetical protein KFL_000130340 [Klebsormidium nitens]|uniref:RPA-interacting protein C-terminal domain-containing protein n=1 Tax=Klebsormidium nitens TaxID=105231 RepID=A0A1Y1HLC0_KLENI|nr:hypothetical protein KFL_000130340 [Klebsormidium nitens]|eukprot:GAQ78452.1 hypothetical protein KFL_000130340 [Klebsormidium nitens]
MQTASNSDHRAALKSIPRPQWKEKLAKECIERVKKDRASLLWQQRTLGNGLRTYASREVLQNILAQELHKVGESPGNAQEETGTPSTSFPRSSDTWIKESSVPDRLALGLEQSYVVELPAEESAVEIRTDGSDADIDMIWDSEPAEVSNRSRDSSGNISDADYEDLMLEMERALNEEMEENAQRHEMAIVMEYEKAEAALRDSIEAHERMMLEGSTPAVLCPLCQKGRLFSSDHSIFCINGDFRIDTQHDHINLEYLQNRLEEACHEHSKNCHHVPGFVLQERFGIKALYLACQDCGALQIVV